MLVEFDRRTALRKRQLESWIALPTRPCACHYVRGVLSCGMLCRKYRDRNSSAAVLPNTLWRRSDRSAAPQQVNPAIIGGLVVDIGDRHVDLSLNMQIRKMESLLMESVSLDK